MSTEFDKKLINPKMPEPAVSPQVQPQQNRTKVIVRMARTKKNLDGLAELHDVESYIAQEFTDPPAVTASYAGENSDLVSREQAILAADKAFPDGGYKLDFMKDTNPKRIQQTIVSVRPFDETEA